MHYTQCPACLTSLQITDKQLELKDGLIRCGHCNDVFNANENKLITTELSGEEDKQSTQSEATSSNTIPNAAIWETTKIPVRHYRHLGSMSFLLAVLFFGQLIYNQASSITQNVSFQPAFKRLNSAFGLQIPPYSNLDDIQIIERQLNLSAQTGQVLLLQLTIKNNALAEQAYPTINVVLTSNLGEAVAQGAFTKYDYLAENETNDFFAALALKKITLTFQKPHEDAAGFEISFSH
ncbi:MAG: zinc-ribbon and DUF3426 domain-containing protein [Cycloclasticus sp.]